jgi:Tol biopolymer transport system component
VAKKYFTSRRSLGAGEMWLYHVSGGEGLQITKRRNDQQDVGEPCVSKDGRYVYFSEDMSPGPNFQYNKDPNGEIYAIRRADRATGEVKNIVTGPAVRCPQVSPDGKALACVHRVREVRALRAEPRDGERRGVGRRRKDQWRRAPSACPFQWT